MWGNERSNSHGPRKGPWLTLTLTALMVGLYLLGDQAFGALVYDRQATQQGELWRLFTGHLVHFNMEHLFWDLLAFVILGAVVEREHAAALVVALVVSCAGVSVWLWFGAASLASYCGLSGALTGIVVLAVILQWKRTGQKAYLWVLAGTIAKLVFELTTHQTLFTNLSDQAVPGAHVAGFFAGLVYVCLALRHTPEVVQLPR